MAHAGLLPQSHVSSSKTLRRREDISSIDFVLRKALEMVGGCRDMDRVMGSAGRERDGINEVHSLRKSLYTICISNRESQNGAMTTRRGKIAASSGCHTHRDKHLRMSSNGYRIGAQAPLFCAQVTDRIIAGY